MFRLLGVITALPLLAEEGSVLLRDVGDLGGGSGLTYMLLDYDTTPELMSAINGENPHAEFRRVQAEFVEAVVAFVRARERIQFLLFECSDLPPFSEAVQRATGLSVYDYHSLISMALSGIRST